MVIRERAEQVAIDIKIYNKYGLKKVVFFDIETTGFNKRKDAIILITYGNFIDNNTFVLKQYFCENLSEEKEILISFSKDLGNKNIFCSYNGISFDEPFIINRMLKHNLFPVNIKEHIDLYAMIRPYHKVLGMERCNLKSVEKFIGVERKDKIDGGLSVELYEDYLNTGDENLKEVLMLHNYEDVLYLPQIFKLIYKIECDNLVRDDIASTKQINYIRYLIKNHDIKVDKLTLDKMSKKAASRIIYVLSQGPVESKTIEDIIKRSY